MSWKLAEDHEISEVRKVYGQTLEQMILDGRPVMVCDADLAGSSGAGYLYDKYPKHTVNFGICEANMVAAAAAMSRIGIRPLSIPLRPLYPDELRIRYVSLPHLPSRIFIFMHQILVTGRCIMGQHIPPLRTLLLCVQFRQFML